jgi:hypothetical protein
MNLIFLESLCSPIREKNWALENSDDEENFLFILEFIWIKIQLVVSLSIRIIGKTINFIFLLWRVYVYEKSFFAPRIMGFSENFVRIIFKLWVNQLFRRPPELFKKKILWKTPSPKSLPQKFINFPAKFP